MEHPLPTRHTEPGPTPKRPTSERARQAWRRSLEKARRVQAKNYRARKRARRKEQARLEKQRRSEERSRQAERWERNLQKKLAWGREHGFFLFRYWCLFVIPFTSTLKRLGESVDQFRRLAEVFERWLVPRPVPAACGTSATPAEGATADSAAAPGAGMTGLRSPSWFRWIAQKVARALAQVVWLEQRYIRLYAREQAIRLEARLKVAAEMQATLRGEQGSEAQVELEGKLAEMLGPNLHEYQLGAMGLGPTREEIWPVRFGRCLAEVILDAVMNGPERRWNLTRLRCRVELLLAAHRTAGQLMTGGDQLPAIVSRLVAGNQPATDGAVLKQACAELRVQILELEQRVRDVRVWERIEARSLDSQKCAELRAEKKRLQAQIVELRAWRRKLKQLSQVESQSVERLGNPLAPADAGAGGDTGAAGVAASTVVNGTNIVTDGATTGPQKENLQPGPPEQTSEREQQGSGQVAPEARPETRLGPIEPGEIDARVDAAAAAETLALEQLTLEVKPADERARIEWLDRTYAADRKVTVAELRRMRAEQPEDVGVLRRWQPGTGLELKTRSWFGQRWWRVEQTAVAGEDAWWLGARELELTAELRARRGRDASTLGYDELKQLLAAALGLTPVRKRARVAAPGVSTPELNRAFEGVARLLWTTVGTQPRRAARRLSKLTAGSAQTGAEPSTEASVQTGAEVDAKPSAETGAAVSTEPAAEPSAEGSGSETGRLLDAFQRVVDDGSGIEDALQSLGGSQGRGGFETRPYGAESEAGAEDGAKSEDGAEAGDEFETEFESQRRDRFETYARVARSVGVDVRFEEGGAALREFESEVASRTRPYRLYVAFGRLLAAMHGDLPEFDTFHPRADLSEEALIRLEA